MSDDDFLMELAMESSSSDDDDDFILAAAHIVHSHSQLVPPPKHRGSISGHKVVHRNREAGHLRLFNDYFADDPIYGPNFFRRRFVFSYYFGFQLFCRS